MKVSVITVCLTSEEHLREAMNSVVQQDYPDVEYLVLDGGSTDGSVDIIRAFAKDHPQVRWWSEPDEGISDAMNRGADRATGDVVAFLHADDYYTDSAVLSTVVCGMSTANDVAWLTGGIREVDCSGSTLREIPVRSFSRRRVLRNNIILHPATFVRRDVFMAAGGFDPTLRYAMDYDLWLRLSTASPPLEMKRVLACFRVHPGSRSSACRLTALDEEYAVRLRYLNSWFEQVQHRIYQLFRRAYENWTCRPR
jgi:glycosyltransferase involved in cell wall biosynthesis